MVMDPRLYVLRMVLRRTMSTAALSQTSALPSTSAVARPSASQAVDSARTSIDAAATASFLEHPGSEYDLATSYLPRRIHPPGPIPWGTLLPSQGVAPPAPRPCNLVARLVAENRFEDARHVAAELRALHTPIMCRAAYLDAALASLAPTAEGKDAFLFWLALVPNRPATLSHPVLKRTWLPVARRLIAQHGTDVDFLAAFLGVAAKKGLLAAVFGPLVAHLATVAPPAVSRPIVELAIATHIASTSGQSASDRARAQLGHATRHVAAWWNAYARAAFRAGWGEVALPPGVAYDKATLAVFGNLPIPSSQSMQTPGHGYMRRLASPDQLAELDIPSDQDLSARLRAALASSPSPTALCELQCLLRLHPSVLDAFKRLFIGLDTAHAARHAPSRNAAKWWHAQLLGLRERSEHRAALDVFATRFLWLGLPRPDAVPGMSSAIGPLDSPSPSRALIHPDIHVLTSTLASLLSLAPACVAAYHAAYLAATPTCPPALHPTGSTHAAFVHAADARDAPAIIRRVLAAGLDPGQAAWSALMAKLVRGDECDAAMRVFAAMEAGAAVGDGGLRMPRPETVTYNRLRLVLKAFGRMDEAEMVRLRQRESDARAANLDHEADEPGERCRAAG